MFAKLYQSETHGQILVKIASSEDGFPEVRFFYQPAEEGVRMASMAITLEADTEKNWQTARKVFDDVTQTIAENAVAISKEQSGVY